MIKNKKEYDKVCKKLDEVFREIEDEDDDDKIGNLFDEADKLWDGIEEYEQSHPDEFGDDKAEKYTEKEYKDECE